jgi:hypothetical protein
MESKTPISDAYVKMLEEIDPKTGKTGAEKILEGLEKEAAKSTAKARKLAPDLTRWRWKVEKMKRNRGT